MRILFSICVFSLALANMLSGQISFENQSTLLGNSNISSGYVMGISDLNNDGLDDIIRFDDAKQMTIDYQNLDGTYTSLNVGTLTNGEIWSVAVADLDHNGINDIITGGYYEPIVQVKNMSDGNLDVSYLTGPNIFMQSATCSDIDNDGFVDYFACNDDFVSSPYKNNGTGDLVYDSLLINTATPDPAFNSGNYACIWTDYDNDGDSDMYLSKCRLGVGDPTDGRRLNRMFKNDGKGNFTDVAEEIGLRPMGQSWATEFGDIDNDGDLDVIMVNHDINTMLFENDGTGNFTDISLDAGIELNSTNFPNGLQTYMYDFDNDTHLDILITSYNVPPAVFHNNGDKTFTRLNNDVIFGTDINIDNTNDIQSGAAGDLNNDGFIDFIFGFANGINIPNGNHPDRMYLNTGNDNNYISVDLEGIISNRSGIGARIEVNGSFGQLIREVKSGQGYGIMNSLQTIVGLGDATEIDNIVVKWPSGQVTITENPVINSHITIEEQGLPVISTVTEICEGDFAVIFGEEIDTPGVYSQTVSTNGMDTIQQVTLVVNPVYNITAAPITACNGSNVVINGETISQSGDVIISDTSMNGCDSITTITVTILEAMDVTGEIVDDWGTVNGAGTITLDVSNVVQPFNISWNTGDIDVTSLTGLLPDTYTAEITDGNGCIETFSFVIGLSSVAELNQQGVEVFPIPAGDLLFVKDANEITGHIEIFSVTGKKIHTQKTNKQTTEILTESMTSGIYIMKIYNTAGKLIGTTKVLKD